MAGTAMTPAMGGAFSGQLPISGEQLTPSALNSVAERLSSHFGPGQISDSIEFFHLCINLARGIDHAVGNNHVPESYTNLPLLLKQICQQRRGIFLQAALMVLMVSVKNACNIGWFSEKETEELLTLANELGSSFCSPRDMSIEENHSPDTISTIMTRFYPLMKMGHILASLEVKPGYGTHMTDFSVSKQTTHSLGEKIRLFVAQKDEIETSKCIISPQLVNFLLNGKAVERRTNVSMDLGPQLPTNVTSMLKYGTNLLQAAGDFKGHYIIVVAFMSVTSSLDTPALQDYVHPDVASQCSDTDIIEGPSRISLNCPISYKRMKTPVKGFSCKHFQCFDFRNFVDINSRRPSWRCPHCNQYVCYTDIRIDQNMAKVLKEVGDNVNDVIISADGSWKVVMETDDNSYLSSQTAPPRTPTANDWQQHFVRSHLNGTQNRGSQQRPFIPAQLGRQTNFPSPIQRHGTYRPNNSSFFSEFQNPHLQQAFNPGMPVRFTSQSPSLVRPSSHAPQTHLQQGIAPTAANTQHAMYMAAQRAAMQITRQPQTTPVHVQTPITAPSSSTTPDGFRMPQSVSSTDDLVSTAPDQNWRPTGRMRGSLQGPAYSAAFSQFMMANTQPVQATRPPNPPTHPLPTFQDLTSE